MSHKLKTTYEIRLKTVKAIMEGRQSTKAAGKELGVNPETIRRWIQNYQSLGEEGIAVLEKNPRYSVSLKENAVKDYLSGKGSLRDICLKYGIRTNTQLRRWIKCYNDPKKGKMPFKSKGRVVMRVGRKTTFEERVAIVKYCIENEHDYAGTAEQFQASYQQVYSYTRKYESQGVNGLFDRRGKRKDDLDMTETDKLRAENKLLEAKLKRAEMENALLKKLEKMERRRD